MPNLPREMQTGRAAAPVVENARLPKMTDRAPAPTPIAGKTVLMPAQPKADTARTGRMAAFKAAAPAALRQPATRAEMQGGKAVTAARGAGYVRLRLRVAGSRVSVAGATAVEGPLVPDSKLDGDLVYEARLGDRRVAVGSVPDAGVRRSFPAPGGPPEMRVHHEEELPVYEVAVRVPASEVALADLPKLEVALFRPKEELPRGPLEARPLAEQFSRQLREVGRLKGIRADKLEAPAQAQLRKALR
jgi:hypothetical protein